MVLQSVMYTLALVYTHMYAYTYICIHIHIHIIHNYTPPHTLPRQHQRWNLTMDESTVLMRRYLVLVFLAMFAMVTLIVLMTRVGRGAAERDPSLDWRANPHVRTGD